MSIGGNRMAASDWLPNFLRTRLQGRGTVRRALDNSAWLFLDQMLRMAGGLIVGVWMARYLGPARFGLLSYAQAIVAVVGACASLGLNAVLVRDLVHAPESADDFLGTAFMIKGVAAAVGWLMCGGVAWLLSATDLQMHGLVLILALGLIFQIFDVLDVRFQARGEAYVGAWGRMAGFVLASAARIALILLRAPVWMFAAAGVGEILLYAAGWLLIGRRRGLRVKGWHFQGHYARVLLVQSWPLALSGLAIYVQAYIDQVMLGRLLGTTELGQYAAALRIVTAFAFLPMVLQTVAAPEIARAKRDDENLYRQRMYNIYRLMLAMFLAVVLPLVFFGHAFAAMLFGQAYLDAAGLLPWLAFRLFFTNFGVARSLFIVNEGLFRFSLLTSLVGVAMNIVLNLFFIPAWGARGAIAASLVSFAMTIFALDCLNSRMRINLRLMIRSVLLPWRRFAG
jgi:O-antigen/teichoic acid export membrane protein